MPTCEKCKSKFPNRIKIDNITKNLGKRKYCLQCSPYNLHNTRNLDEISSIIDPNGNVPKEKVCPSCNKTLPISNFGIHQKKDRKRKPFCIFTICKKCDSDRVKECKRQIKQQAVDYKGGKCCKCGYCKCLRSLDFHHQDPSQKDFGVAQFKKNSFDDTMKRELDKCILVCKNCHGELHEEIENQKE